MGAGELDHDGVVAVLLDGIPAGAGVPLGTADLTGSVQSTRKALLSKPSAARAYREWSASSGLIMAMPSCAAAVTRSAEG